VAKLFGIKKEHEETYHENERSSFYQTFVITYKKEMECPNCLETTLMKDFKKIETTRLQGFQK
jgi:hypothetical protein